MFKSTSCFYVRDFGVWWAGEEAETDMRASFLFFFSLFPLSLIVEAKRKIYDAGALVGQNSQGNSAASMPTDVNTIKVTLQSNNMKAQAMSAAVDSFNAANFTIPSGEAPGGALRGFEKLVTL
jgi:hypothetical protein